jgi:hypothetical protein
MRATARSWSYSRTRAAWFASRSDRTPRRGSLQERGGCGREDVGPVLRGEVDRAVHLEDILPAGLVGRDVDAGKVDAQCGDRAQRERTRSERRAHAPANTAERDVRPPFTGEGTALDGADDAARRDYDAEVPTCGFDERLDERTVATEPLPVPETVEDFPELVFVATEIHVAAPTAKARLHDVRGRKRRYRHVADVCRSGLCDARAPEEEGRRQLVVGGEQSDRTVQHLHTVVLKPGELPETWLDPVERRQDVDAPDGNVALHDARRCGAVDEPGSVPELRKGCGQSAIRLGLLAEDDDRAFCKTGRSGAVQSAVLGRSDRHGHRVIDLAGRVHLASMKSRRPKKSVRLS